MDFTGKPFEASDRKKYRKKTLAKKTVERKDSESNKSSYALQTVRFKLNKTRKKQSDQNC